MFISRAAYEGLIRENARLSASCDWLSQLVNQLQTERQILLERVLNVQVPVMTIEREERATAREADLTPDMLSKLAASFIKPMPTDAAPGKVYQPPAESAVPTAVGEAMAAMALFDDMGDAAARRAGVDWTPDGELQFSR